MKQKRSILMLLFDTLWPIYLAVVLFFVIWKWIDLPWPAEAHQDALLGAALTVSSVVVGFLISAKAIIISGSGRPMEQIREMGLVLELTDTFRLAIYLAMIFSLICTIGFFGQSGRVYEALWTCTGTAMLYSFLRISNLLFRIVGAS